MKSKIRLVLIACCSVFTIGVFLVSCSQDNITEETTSQIRFNLGSGSLLGKSLENDFSAIIVTVVDQHGEVVYDREVLPLFNMGEGYLSETLLLKTGDYTLTEFLVLNSDNEVTHATPLEGSELAYLVEDPLPISFTVEEEKVTQVIPEVLEVTDESSDQFGYAIFGISVVDVIRFKLGVFTYNAGEDSLTLTSSTIRISTGDTLFSKSLSATIQTVIVRNDQDQYQIEISKPGFGSYIRTFTASELEHHTNTPFIVTLYPQSFYEGLQLYYSFQGDQLDYSGNNHHATNYGATLTEDKDGNINSAYSFDGFNNFMDCGNILDDLTYPFTVSVWVKPSDHTGRLYNTIFTAQDNSPLYNGFEIHISHGTSVGVQIGDGQGENSGAYSRFKSATIDDKTGMWTNVTAVVKGNNDMTLYVNGVDVGGYYAGYTTNPINSNFPQDVARMGRWTSNGNTYYYTGLIDEFKVWNRALTPEEIKASR